MSELQEAGYLNSIQVGKPATHPANGVAQKQWTSGIFKREVNGAIWLGRENLVGDGQHDKKHHGGPDRAVLSYASVHYIHWAAELGEALPAGFAPGAFGENFTVSGLDEATVCLGDVYVLGEAEIEVSQPRLPCANLARRWQLAELPRLVEETGRGGWYARVLREGAVEAEQLIYRKARPYPEWTIRRLTEVFMVRSNRADDETSEAWAWLAELRGAIRAVAGHMRKKLGRVKG